MVNYNYYKEILREKSLPAAFVDLDLLDKNIEAIVEKAGPKNIRIASKSIRCAHLLKYIVNSNEKYQGIMCYSADEAIYLSNKGFDDLLIAYPITNLTKIKNVCHEIGKEKKIIFMCDCEQHINAIFEIAKQLQIQVPICIDIDMSTRLPLLHFGVRRSPICTAESVLSLVERIVDKKNLTFHGIMGYEAQIAGLADYSPNNNIIVNTVIKNLKKYSQAKVKKLRSNIVKTLAKNGHTCALVNGGGTGSLHLTSLEEEATEVTVGSGFFASHLFDYYNDFKYLSAAAYAIEITRIPTKNIYTCHGGGYVASGTGKDKIPKPYLPPDCTLLTTEGAGEVQTPICYKGKETLALGDPIIMRHSKAGELCEHFNDLLLIKDREIIEIVKTYRGEGQCFL